MRLSDAQRQQYALLLHDTIEGAILAAGGDAEDVRDVLAMIVRRNLPDGSSPTLRAAQIRMLGDLMMLPQEEEGETDSGDDGWEWGGEPGIGWNPEVGRVIRDEVRVWKKGRDQHGDLDAIGEQPGTEAGEQLGE